MRILLVVFTTVLLGLSSLMAQDNFKETYIGSLNHELVEASQLAKLDFIVARKKDNVLELSAVLKLYLGDFNSKEYITYHFENIQYDLLNGLLYFNDPGQDFTLKTMSFKSGRLEAVVYSAISGRIGTLNMSKEEATVVPRNSLIRPIWGLYEGQCKGEKERLYLYTYKSNQDTHRLGNPYGAYRLMGYVARLGGVCGEGFPWCNNNSIIDGVYNFYEQVLNLRGKTFNFSCDVKENEIACGQCVYSRISRDEVGSRVEFAVDREGISPGRLDELVEVDSAVVDDQIEGNYKGYLYHEDTKQFQKMKLSLISYQKKADNGQGSALHLSLTANLIFGDWRSQQRLTYKFPDQEYILLNKYMTFSNLGGSSNATVQVEEMKDGIVKGIWFSSIYGKVGKFIVTKNDNLVDIEEGPFFSSLENVFESDLIDLTLTVINSPSPFKNENPFAPLAITGRAWFRSAISKRKLITDSSFDFFTGRIGLELDGGKQYMIGERSRDGQFKLRIRNTLYGTLVNHFEPDDYVLKRD